MSETKPVYSGEAVLRGRGESDKAGMWVRLELEDAGGVHPFKGFEGERFAVVIVGPLASAEHSSLGDAPTREDGVSGARLVDGSTAPKATSSPATKPKRRWQDMPASQRAALWVKDKGVWTYITEAFGFECWSEDVADHWLKKRLHIVSKSELDTDDAAAHHFDLLSSKFRAWQQARGHGVV